MQMSFFFSDEVVLLFDFWSVHSPTGMVLSVLVILLLSVLYETVKIGKAKVLHRTMLSIPHSLSQESLAEQDEGTVDTSHGQHGTTQGSTFRDWVNVAEDELPSLVRASAPTRPAQQCRCNRLLLGASCFLLEMPVLIKAPQHFGSWFVFVLRGCHLQRCCRDATET
ncbi:protein SLC31A2 isoform X1 [Apteryx mantelli]|uniref:Copper transport protein n=1 Tax=Apteryx mantelli TaxID=2696672 RepID=A0ABM4FJ18_9AVES